MHSIYFLSLQINDDGLKRLLMKLFLTVHAVKRSFRN